MPGRIIALEGIDQSGKRTQAHLLARRLGQSGAKASILSFPIYESPAGRAIRAYLTAKQTYPAEALHMLYSLNRWENKQRLANLVNKAEFVISDRYIPSNLAYGVARRLNLDWLRCLDKGLPSPNLVIVLDVPVESSFHRKSMNRDIHERDREFLSKVRLAYRRLAQTLGWKVVDGTGTVHEVHAEIWSMVFQRFNLHIRGKRSTST